MPLLSNIRGIATSSTRNSFSLLIWMYEFVTEELFLVKDLLLLAVKQDLITASFLHSNALHFRFTRENHFRYTFCASTRWDKCILSQKSLRSLWSTSASKISFLSPPWHQFLYWSVMSTVLGFLNALMWIIDEVVWTEMYSTLFELWTAFIPRL